MLTKLAVSATAVIAMLTLGLSSFLVGCGAGARIHREGHGATRPSPNASTLPTISNPTTSSHAPSRPARKKKRRPERRRRTGFRARTGQPGRPGRYAYAANTSHVIPCTAVPYDVPLSMTSDKSCRAYALRDGTVFVYEGAFVTHDPRQGVAIANGGIQALSPHLVPGRSGAISFFSAGPNYGCYRTARGGLGALLANMTFASSARARQLCSSGTHLK
jgi:hypothetical protein